MGGLLDINTSASLFVVLAILHDLDDKNISIIFSRWEDSQIVRKDVQMFCQLWHKHVPSSVYVYYSPI